MVLILCLSVLKSSCSKPLLALHPEMRKERWWQSHITKSYYLSATVAHFVVTATFS